MSSEREDLAEVLSAHRIVGVSGYGIESVMCACQYNGWTGGGKWHPADWHPRHVAKKLRAAQWRPPTERTDAEVHADELLLWIDYCLSLPMYQNVISDFGQGVVETYRAARKVLIKGLHPDAARLATDRKGAES